MGKIGENEDEIGKLRQSRDKIGRNQDGIGMKKVKIWTEGFLPPLT